MSRLLSPRLIALAISNVLVRAKYCDIKEAVGESLFETPAPSFLEVPPGGA